jgi:hypothetical protein
VTGDRVIRFTTAAVVCAVAAFAAVVSYSHIYGLGRAHGQDGTGGPAAPAQRGRPHPGRFARAPARGPQRPGRASAGPVHAVARHRCDDRRERRLRGGIRAARGADLGLARGGVHAGWREVVWPVSRLVRGRAWPAGRTLPGGAGSLLPGPCGSGLAPGLARRGTRAWQAGKEPDDAAPFTYLPFAASGGAVTVSCSGRSYHGLPSLCLLSRSSQSPYVPSCARFVTDSVVRPVA